MRTGGPASVWTLVWLPSWCWLWWETSVFHHVNLPTGLLGFPREAIQGVSSSFSTTRTWKPHTIPFPVFCWSRWSGGQYRLCENRAHEGVSIRRRGSLGAVLEANIIFPQQNQVSWCSVTFIYWQGLSVSLPHASCENINVNKIDKVSCIMEPTVYQGRWTLLLQILNPLQIS